MYVDSGTFCTQVDFVLKCPRTGHPALERLHYMISTVKENRVDFTEREFQGAKQARRPMRVLSCPTPEHLRNFICQNLAKDCPITLTDVNNAEKIFDPDVGALKGKSTRSKLVPIKEDVVAIPKGVTEQHSKLVLHFDLMFINGFPLLTCIDGSIQFRTTIPLHRPVASRHVRDPINKLRKLLNSCVFTS
jgi:hypothetical protein